MRNVNEAYLAILKIEMADLHDDIQVLIDECTKEREQGGLTNYVFMENLALFKNELLGVDAFQKVIDDTDIGSFPTLDEMVDHLTVTFREKAKVCGLAEVINIYVARKLDKVRKYVTQIQPKPQPVAFRSDLHA